MHNIFLPPSTISNRRLFFFIIPNHILYTSPHRGYLSILICHALSFYILLRFLRSNTLLSDVLLHFHSSCWLPSMLFIRRDISCLALQDMPHKKWETFLRHNSAPAVICYFILFCGGLKYLTYLNRIVFASCPQATRGDIRPFKYLMHFYS